MLDTPHLVGAQRHRGGFKARAHHDQAMSSLLNVGEALLDHREQQIVAVHLLRVVEA